MNKELFIVIKNIAKEYNIDPYFIYAVGTVESNNKGFDSNGNIVVRFEKHVFSKYIKKDKNTQYLIDKVNELKGSGFNTFKTAVNLDEHKALLSTSFGMFQIMGFNYDYCGYRDVESFVDSLAKSEENQIRAFCNFVIKNNLVRYINDRNYSRFAYYYNGPAYEKNDYDNKLEKAYLNVVKQVQ